jgi:cytochrome c553
VINKPPVPEIEGPQQVEGSSLRFTQAQIDSIASPPDWFPEEHAPTPRVIRDGSVNGGWACGSCHLPNGHGHPESADLVGLTEAYFIQAMAEYKSGVRKDPIRMTLIAQLTSEQDVREAAAYFARLKPNAQPYSRTVERDVVPKTYLGQGRMRHIDPDGGGEPIGNRIITVPEDTVKVRARDPRAGFIAYAPVGSIARGRALAAGGAGKTIDCTICHGEGLKGLGDVPRLAGIHPIYLVRQLYNFQTGASNGPNAQLMKRVVANLTDEDIVALAAYAGSLTR